MEGSPFHPLDHNAGNMGNGGFMTSKTIIRKLSITGVHNLC